MDMLYFLVDMTIEESNILHGILMTVYVGRISPIAVRLNQENRYSSALYVPMMKK